MRNKFLVSFLIPILICFIGCGGDEVEEDIPLEVVNIICDGDTITVEFNNKPQLHEIKVSYIFLTIYGPRTQLDAFHSQFDNLIFIHGPISLDKEYITELVEITIEWNSGIYTFPDPCD